MAHEAEHRVLHQVQRLVAIAGSQFSHAQGAPFDRLEKPVERVIIGRGQIHAVGSRCGAGNSLGKAVAIVVMSAGP